MIEIEQWEYARLGLGTLEVIKPIISLTPRRVTPQGRSTTSDPECTQLLQLVAHATE